MPNFYHLDAFPELQALQQHAPKIREEVQKSSFWMQWGSDNYDPLGHCKFLSGDWTICPLHFGRYFPENMRVPGMSGPQVKRILYDMADRFPETIHFLREIRSLNFSALSRLHSKSKLAPHRHNNPRSLIFHMGIIIPPDQSCGLRVNGETHLWTQTGDAVIFDDTLEHSAWNDSDEERIVLYIDFVRPRD